MYDLYRENILDHSQHMRHKGVLDPADIDLEMSNPLCGDRLRLTLRLDENRRIAAIGWSGEGCAISQASASMLGEAILGKTLDEVQQIGRQDVLDMIGIPLSMNRVKCGLLSLKTVTVALYGLGEWQRIAEADEDEA
jgi:nitrogen fixation NifU-like protein